MSMITTSHDTNASGQAVQQGPFGPHDHPHIGIDKAAEWLGVTVSEYAEGYAKGHMSVRSEMLNGFAIAHGGMIFSFADTIFAWACNNPDSDGATISVTQGADINFLASPPLGAKLTAVGRRHETTGRSGLCDVTIYDEQDAVIAELRGRFRTVTKPQG